MSTFACAAVARILGFRPDEDRHDELVLRGLDRADQRIFAAGMHDGRAHRPQSRSLSDQLKVAVLSPQLDLRKLGQRSPHLFLWRHHCRGGEKDVGPCRVDAPTLQSDGAGAVPSGKWLEFEGGVISGSFNQPGPALSRRRRSRHDDG